MPPAFLLTHCFHSPLCTSFVLVSVLIVNVVFFHWTYVIFSHQYLQVQVTENFNILTCDRGDPWETSTRTCRSQYLQAFPWVYLQVPVSNWDS